jgi:iron complex transport system substrate-binding protein
LRSKRLSPLVVVLVAAALLASACGGSDSNSSGAAEGSGSSSASGSTGESTYPITIEHVFGETVIESKPERIATVAWANHEVPLALGVVPVGMSKATWGDDDGDGVLPWVEDRLEELDAETPVLFDETDGIDAEAVADTNPDVILAAYSGLTEEDYATLSKIAPVVAYPEIAWGTSVTDMILLNSQAMGMAAEGEQLVADLEEEIDDAFAAHPQLADKSILFSYVDPTDSSEIGFYTTHDTRPGFLHELGMGIPSLVEERSAGTDAFYETISAEQADELDDVDILVLYGTGFDETLGALRADGLLGTVPAIERGSVVVLENSTPLAASANPSPLSIGWGLDDYFALIASAADKA